MAENVKQSVLIIESDEAIRDNLKHRFSKRGMLVITAKDGYEGYIRACSENPDLIIIESLLSSISGFRVSRLLKFDDRYKQIRIVMMTANELTAVKEMYEACGADYIIRKPFKFRELIDAIEQEVVA
tara:strand:- start:794 stop:1174 length:381 start_codon:yes stop_codon:yes gene_type:complete